jgi:protein-disulfide isomerase
MSGKGARKKRSTWPGLVCHYEPAGTGKLGNALVTGEYRKKVRGDFMGGVRSGVNGTPTFFIIGMRHDGAFDYASLVWAIQIRLAAA